MKKLFAFLCLLGSAFATTTVSGNLKDAATNVVSAGSFVRFYLRGCGSNQPRVNGTALIPPRGSQTYYVDLSPDTNGAIAGTVYSTRDAAGTGNGEITCGTSLTSAFYGVVVYFNGSPGVETPVHAKNGVTLDLTNLTAITTSPVVMAPTGDGTYSRLDGGNTPFTGAVQFNSFFTVGGTRNQNIPAGDAGHISEFINDNSQKQVLRISTYGSAASLQGQNNVHFFRAGGTLAIPTAVLLNDLGMSIGIRAHDGTVSSLSAGAIQAIFTENWNATSHGVKFHLETTPNGSTARTGLFDFFGNGQIGASLGFVTGGAANSNLPGGDANYLAEIINNATSNQNLRLSTYGLAASLQGQNLIHLFRAGGTLTSPTAVVNNDLFGGLASRGYDGTVSSLTSGTCYFQATENWNNTSHGTKFHCDTTPNGSTTRNSGWDLLGNGDTGIPGKIVNTAGTATMGMTLKKGSGAGDYVHSADTNFIDVDGTNLALTVTIPTNWKLGVVANAEMSVNTATTNIFLAINDSVAATQVTQVALTPAAVGTLYSAGLSWIITGDGASHTVKLQYKTATGADAAVITNSTTRFPTMIFTLMPSN